MTHQDSCPPVAKPLPITRAGLRRYAWIPAIVILPLVGLGAYAWMPSDPPTTEPKEDALGALASAEDKAEAPAPGISAQPPTPAVAEREPVDALVGDTDEEVAEAFDDLGEEELPVDIEPAGDDGEEEQVDATAKRVGEAGDGFWIQAASLRLKEKADRLAQKLVDKGYDAHSMAYGGPRAGWWHVVRIGPYVTRLEAEKARLAFSRAERMSTAVVPRAHGPFYVQIASLRSEAGAKKEARKLQRLGHNAIVGSIKTSKRGTWHTIRVGPFDFEMDAYGYQKLLEDDGVRGEITPRPKSPPPKEPEAAESSRPVEHEPASAPEGFDVEAPSAEADF